MSYIPTHLNGTPAGELLAEIHAAAAARGLTVIRTWERGRYGGAAVYTARNRSGETLHTERVDGLEGKTLRAKSSDQLRSLLTFVGEYQELEREEIPSVRIPGTYLVPEAVTAQLRALGSIWDRTAKTWVAPPAAMEEATALLSEWRAERLGRLSREHGADPPPPRPRTRA